MWLIKIETDFLLKKIICDYNKVYIPNSPEEEREIKKLLSNSNEMTDKDYEWIRRI